MFTLLNWFDDRLAQVEKILLIILTFALVTLLIAQVFLRYVLNSPLFWAEEVAVQVFVAISFFGVSYLIYQKQLVVIDFITLILPTSLRLVIECVFQIISLLTLLVMLVLTFQWITEPMVQNELSPTTQLPRWYNYSVLMFALGAMSFHQLKHCFKSLSGLFRGGKS
ncbi:TRAP transporter small permease [Marinomonas polaris]|uniref:TRAP transporter small permease n=1 Tax=Marinomonas polaris TaxID=293552 RepID=UPI003F96749B